MMRFTLFWCLFLTFVNAEEAPSFEVSAYRSDLLVGGVVNPLNGQVSLQHTDLIAKGAENVSLKRVFIPHNLPPLLGADPYLDYFLAPSSEAILTAGVS